MRSKDDPVTQQTQDTRHEKIAVRAHGLWEGRGRPIGSPEEDWSRAKEEIRIKETAEQSERNSKQGSESRDGCSSQHRTPVSVDEKAAAVGDELVRARNKAVRDHHHAPAAEGIPPFSDHSGSL
jgi:Protein of unknown function (DUF2934)